MARAAEPGRRQAPRGKSLRALAAVAFLSSTVAAQDFRIWPAAEYDDAPAVAFNRHENNWIVLAHHNGVLSMRRAHWHEDTGPEAGVIRTLDAGWAASYAIAHNWESNTYLAVWTAGYDVRVARVDNRARRIDDPITLYSSASEILAVDVVFLGVDRNRWLVVWQKYVGSGPDQLLMQVFKADGTVDGPIFDIGSLTYGEWSIACNTGSGRLMLVWEGAASLLGRFFLHDGTIDSELLTVGSGHDPALCYAKKAKRWLIAWDSGFSVEGRLVASGVLQPTFTISSDSHVHYPGIAYSPISGRFEVAWMGYADTHQVLGQSLTGAGAPVGGRHFVSTNSLWKNNRNEESLDCSTLEGRCLAAWRQGDEIWGRFFTEFRQLTVGVSGTGGGWVLIQPPDLYCQSCSHGFPIGEPIELEPNPYSGSFFTGWTGDTDCLDGLVTLDADTSCTAGFDLKPRLTVSLSGSGGGLVTSSPWGISCPTDCSQYYLPGTVVQLTPDPDPGSTFTGWSGHGDCLDGQLTMMADRSCSATFTRTWVLTVSLAGAGSGQVISQPAGIDCGADCSEAYPEGTSVALSPVPDMGSEFTGWSGDGDCADGLLTMIADTACEATFGPCSIPSEVTVSHAIIDGPQTHSACNVLQLGPEVTITGSGEADLWAGNSVRLVGPLTVGIGCRMQVRTGWSP